MTGAYKTAASARLVALLRAGLCALLLAALSVTLPAMAQDKIGAGEAAAIQGAVQGQLDAFQRDDAAAAYAFAAPNIQSRFPTPDAFLAMVRRVYAPVYRPRQVEFGAPERRDGIVVQDVEIVGPDGRPVVAAYTLERDAGGRWRITGCSLLPSVRVSA